MMDISTPEILTIVPKVSGDPNINFPGNGKYQQLKFPVPTSGEKTLRQNVVMIEIV